MQKGKKIEKQLDEMSKWQSNISISDVGDLTAYLEALSIILAITIMHCKFPVRNICPINYCEVDRKNTCAK